MPGCAAQAVIRESVQHTGHIQPYAGLIQCTTPPMQKTLLEQVLQVRCVSVQLDRTHIMIASSKAVQPHSTAVTLQ
jgi:hypothetical protein